MTGAPPGAGRPPGLLAAALAEAGLPWPVLTLEAALDTPAEPAPPSAATAEVTAEATAGATAIVALDRWTPDQAAALSARAWRSGGTLLPVRVDGSTALVGPLLHRGAPACLGCVEAGRLAAAGGRTPRDQGALLLGGVAAPTAVPLLAALAASALADPARRPGTMWAVRTDDGTCSAHRARPRPGGCPLCGPLPEDSPELAAFVPAVRPPAGPRRLRQDNPATTRAGLRAALYDWRLGPVVALARQESYPLAFVGAAIAGERVEPDAGYGRAPAFADAERVALFEAVERMTGTAPRGKRTVLRGSYAALGPARAVDPERFGRYEPHVADLPGSRIARYTPDTVTDWVHGWSMGGDRAVAVPEQLAYWGLPRRRTGGAPPFVLESSSGCGLGNSLEEAVLHGLFEVAERDAFLMAWYARTPLARVAPPDDDPLVGHAADLLDALGYDLLLFDATNDFGVPAVASLALCRDAGSAAPQAFFAAGAHHDPLEAIRSAVVEAVVSVGAVARLARTSPATLDRERLRPMLDDPGLVAVMDDHTALFTLPEARARFAFLLEGAAPRPWHQVWPGSPRPVPDLGALLAGTAARVAGAGMDVVVVDQTDPVVRDDLGLYAAKVLVPGALPMTFGHRYRRTRGLPRLLEVPWRLGRLPDRPRYEDLPLDPHPFP
ncbi:TOMM precursor leader peptide-binding protein [Streptomyces sp. V4-01]|uniref:TOMM leader peptide-binding protein n=1 Tax=Actinacidiphila polyblastidii TaxID=3110430 RepID=A0ABU7PJ86_9ACTN|nr:TOMM precursor leader peptide-binding protein [Streptomyces sp. V4-01]